MFLVDAHLDLSYNALRGRDVLQPAALQQPDSEGIPSVGLPDLRAGHVGLICATIFCQPAGPDMPGYHSADEAHAAAQAHLDWYRRQFDAGQMLLVTHPDQLPDANKPPQSLAAILLLEGADALRHADDVAAFFQAGLRIVGLAWKRTRLAGGTGAPGPLTPEGLRLVADLDRFGILHDVSHLAEQSFWQLLDLSSAPVLASHSNCRAIVDTDRQLSDAMIRALAARHAVIGVNFYDKFLLGPLDRGQRRATLSDVVYHIQHLCDIAGSARHVGLGTDMDGGLGRDQIPVEIRSSADLPRLADALSAAHFSDADVRGIMGGNWTAFFRRTLPA